MDGQALGFDGGTVRPGDRVEVGEIWLHVDAYEEQDVSLRASPSSPYLVSTLDGTTQTIPVERLSYLLERDDGRPMAEGHLQWPQTELYSGPLIDLARLSWSFEPQWSDRGSPQPYRVTIEHTLTAAGVPDNVAAVHPARVPRGGTLTFYVFTGAVPASPARLALARPVGGRCLAFDPDLLRPLGTFRLGWNAFSYRVDQAQGPYCFAIFDGRTNPSVIAAGRFYVEEPSSGGALTVRVVDHGTRRPVDGASVLLGREGEEPGRSACPGVDGTVRFSGLPSARYHVSATAPGYATGRAEALVTQGHVAQEVDVLLVPAPRPSLRLEVRLPEGKRALVAGDVVEVRAHLEWPAWQVTPGGPEPRASVAIRLPDGLAIVPDSWKYGAAGPAGVQWRPPILHWSVSPGEERESVLAFEAAVVPWGADARRVITAGGEATGPQGQVVLGRARLELAVDRGFEARAVVIGRVPGDEGTAARVVASEEGIVASVGPGGYFVASLSPGVHVLWVEQTRAGGAAPLRGAPAVVVVDPAATVPLVLEGLGPGREPGRAGGAGWFAAGGARLQWEQGGSPEGSGALVAALEGAWGHGRAEASATIGGVSLNRVVVENQSHRLVVGALSADRGDPVTVPPPGTRLLPAAASLALEGHGVAWEWRRPAVPAAPRAEVEGLRSLLVWNHQRDGGVLQVSRGGPSTNAWVRLESHGAHDGGASGSTRLSLAAGWQGQEALLQHRSELRWDLPRAVTRSPGPQAGAWELQLAAPSGTGVLEGAWQGLSWAGEVHDGGMPWTRMEWVQAVPRGASLVAQTGMGASLGDGMELYALAGVMEPDLPVQGSGPGDPWDVLPLKGALRGEASSSRGVLVRAGVAHADPGTPGSLVPLAALDAFASTRPSSPWRLEAGLSGGIRASAPAGPARVWASLEARPREAVAISLRATAELMHDEGVDLGLRPSLSLGGEVRPLPPLRLAGRLGAATGSVRIEETSLEYRAGRVAVSLHGAPGEVVVSGAVSEPTSGPTAAWAINARAGWRATPAGARLDGAVTVISTPVSAVAEVSAGGGAVRASVSAAPGGAQSAPFARLSWSRTPAPLGQGSLDTAAMEGGWRQAVAGPLGCFAEVGLAMQRLAPEGVAVHRALRAAAGISLALGPGGVHRPGSFGAVDVGYRLEEGAPAKVFFRVTGGGHLGPVPVDAAGEPQ